MGIKRGYPRDEWSLVIGGGEDDITRDEGIGGAITRDDISTLVIRPNNDG
ncbi:MAG: hypothetical protein ACHQU0_02300 [Candidatus Paceibacteria bacterium]